ncbi:hypothetical protein BRADI_3g39073v3 [Brachypodium distachyon]|nr:hypothetical protein BRADI_3g39073v3 [Brachypodium distachyon]
MVMIRDKIMPPATTRAGPGGGTPDEAEDKDATPLPRHRGKPDEDEDKGVLPPSRETFDTWTEGVIDTSDNAITDEFLHVVESEVRTAVPRQYYSSTSSAGLWTQPPTIYSVPRELAEDNARAYAPVAACIGPLVSSKVSRRDEAQEAVHRYKRCCVRRLIAGRHLQLGGSEDPAAWTDAERQRLRTCLATLKRLLPRIRASYDLKWDNDDEVVAQMLLDGCFVLHRLLKYGRAPRTTRRPEVQGKSGGGDDDDDDDWTLVFGRCWVWGFITYDLLLLENQIPFFVLRALHHVLKTRPDDGDDVLVTGALELFRPLHPHSQQHGSRILCRDVHHLLHLFYLSIGFPTTAPTAGELRASSRGRHLLPSTELPLWVPCAKELEEAGVKLRARKRGAKSFLDVQFRGGVLEIPPLRLYDYSEPVFRNLIAFEQTYPGTRGDVTAYAIFMACLVTTHEDMRLLHKRGVLVNQMSSGDRGDATRFFSRICSRAHTSAGSLNYLGDLMEEVVKYQRGRWPRWRASLVRNYFRNPWVTTSVVAAAVLLFLTVVQAFFAAYAYFKPPAPAS